MTQVKPQPSFFRRLWREFLEPIVFAIVITQFVATLVGVDGASMMPNLRHHERVLVPKYETWLHKVGIGDFKRGDVLIFKQPTEFLNKNPEYYRDFFGLWKFRPFLIKRLIGLPGDKVRISQGVVYVNGQRLDGSFTTSYWKQQNCWDTQSDVANNIQASSFTGDAKEITVPAGHYFLMGDNRTPTGSEDSRAFGPVARKDIAGRAVAVVWPIFRKANATFTSSGCPTGTVQPDQFINYSGSNELNLRLLVRPPAFGELNKP